MRMTTLFQWKFKVSVCIGVVMCKHAWILDFPLAIRPFSSRKVCAHQRIRSTISGIRKSLKAGKYLSKSIFTRYLFGRTNEIVNYVIAHKWNVNRKKWATTQCVSAVTRTRVYCSSLSTLTIRALFRITMFNAIGWCTFRFLPAKSHHDEWF